MGIIRVNGIRLYAYHGCLKEEAKIGTEYEVNVVLHTNFDEAAKMDDLTKTIDYVTVNEIVERQVAIRSKLIEHVAQRIINELKETFTTLEKVSVSVAKINPPINGNVASVAVELEG